MFGEAAGIIKIQQREGDKVRRAESTIETQSYRADRRRDGCRGEITLRPRADR